MDEDAGKIHAIDPERPPDPLLPEWAASAFHRHLDGRELADQLLHLSIRGIASTTARPEALRALVAHDELLREYPRGESDQTSSITEPEIQLAEREAGLAAREASLGFPLLHGQAIVALWGSLEHVVTDFARDWILNRPDAALADEVTKLRVLLGDYLGRTDTERAEFIVQRLEQELGASRRKGIDRFECLLSPFGLSGSFPPDLARDIYELQQVRNVIVHRAGIADRRFVDACPWFALTVGEELHVSHEQYVRVSRAVGEYVLEMIQRVRVAFGLARLSGETLAQLTKAHTESVA